jgi:mRNA-degrading endonuclease toxin of MazEF toxin-antitoxin module
MPLPVDIVLAAFPFTDLSNSKRRPYVVLAAAESPGDFIVAFVTTGAPVRFPRFGVFVAPSHPDWKPTRLKLPSVIRADRLCTLNTKVISGRVGVLSTELQNDVRQQLKLLFHL